MKALITEEFHPILKEELEKLNIDVDERIDSNYDSVCEVIDGYEILIVNSKIRIDQELIHRAPRLKIVGRIGSGMDIFDIEACEKRNIQILTSPEGNANAVAEHVLGFLLSALNNLQISQNKLLDGHWDREGNRGVELCGKTISIIGFGHNGARLAELLQGFDVQILAYDIRSIQTKTKNVRQTSLEEIYQETDVLSIHLPLNGSTTNFVNDKFLANFKKKIYFINASRGKICPVSTILDHLEKGNLIKAMLDVYDSEPVNPTIRMKNFCEEGRLLLTPHIAGWTHESKFKLAKILAEKIKTKLIS